MEPRCHGPASLIAGTIRHLLPMLFSSILDEILFGVRLSSSASPSTALIRNHDIWYHEGFAGLRKGEVDAAVREYMAAPHLPRTR